MRASRGMGIINPKKLKAGGPVKGFKSHMMYNKKTGKGIRANTHAKHLELKRKGFGHTKPTNMNVGGKVNKVVKGLEKASKTHAKQAKTLKSLKLKKGGSVKDACYHKVKASYKVFPSDYASGAIAKCRKKKGKK